MSFINEKYIQGNKRIKMVLRYPEIPKLFMIYRLDIYRPTLA